MKEGDKSPSIRHGEQWTQRGGVPFKQVLKRDTFKGTYTATYSLLFGGLPLFVHTNIHINSYRPTRDLSPMEILIWMCFFSHTVTACKDHVILFFFLFFWNAYSSVWSALLGRNRGATGDGCVNYATGENQQEIFISSPIASKDPIWIPQSAISKQMWWVAPVKFLLLGWSGAWSEVWTKLLLGQTNSCLPRRRGARGGTPLSSTHSPSPHPAVPLHLRPHPLTPPVFYVHFDFLPPVVIQAEEGGVPSWRTQNC